MAADNCYRNDKDSKKKTEEKVQNFQICTDADYFKGYYLEIPAWR